MQDHKKSRRKKANDKDVDDKKSRVKTAKPDKGKPKPKQPEPASPTASPPTPPPPGGRVEAFLACARQALGGVYCTPANEPECTDCSGLVRRCYRQATGQNITGDSHEQIKLGAPVPRSAVQPGDLLFWDTMNGTEERGGNTASHVGIASSSNRMINALTWGMGISESDLSSPYWTQEVRFLGARRLEF